MLEMDSSSHAIVEKLFNTLAGGFFAYVPTLVNSMSNSYEFIYRYFLEILNSRYGQRLRFQHGKRITFIRDVLDKKVDKIRNIGHTYAFVRIPSPTNPYTITLLYELGRLLEDTSFERAVEYLRKICLDLGCDENVIQEIIDKNREPLFKFMMLLLEFSIEISKEYEVGFKLRNEIIRFLNSFVELLYRLRLMLLVEK